MRRLLYLMNTSLDGYVEGPDGSFAWTVHDEEVHRFHSQLARDLGANLYGRRMYETMKVWQDLDGDPTAPDHYLEYARIWKEKPKVVFSTTLDSVGPNCRLVKTDAVAEVARLKEEPGGDLAVSGPGLASSLARAGLIDEYRLVVNPILLGGGKPYLRQQTSLRLVETRTFRSGAVYLRYQRA